MQSHFAINVAKSTSNPSWDGKGFTYKHFFATAEQSCIDVRDAAEVLKSIREKFPFPEFRVSITYWKVEGQSIDLNKEGKFDGIELDAEDLNELRK